ncbi:hypothetical protein Ahy_B08g092896 [Arachis hypogaea]|uniref:Uncharacterized protein n=1 Tax=Arachis hypogaea TaxID=3818 RepID=A0A444Y507_ARAHY|nr:hypothetical protein Ahy_B08g092896 [Arachis hypogaea]
MVFRKRKKIVDDSSSESESESDDEILEVNLESENDPILQTQTNQSSVNKPSDSMLEVEEESFTDPAQQQMIIVRKEIHSQSEPLEIVPLQMCMPPLETRPPSPVENEPTPQKSPSEKIKEQTVKGTPQPHQPTNGTPAVSVSPSKIQPPPQATAALMMMARTTYVPKEFLAPSFSLGLTDSSQEETVTQEGRAGSQKEKNQESPIQVEDLEELVE